MVRNKLYPGIHPAPASSSHSLRVQFVGLGFLSSSAALVKLPSAPPPPLYWQLLPIPSFKTPSLSDPVLARICPRLKAQVATVSEDELILRWYVLLSHCSHCSFLISASCFIGKWTNPLRDVLQMGIDGGMIQWK
jgi:hypothetical protein